MIWEEILNASFARALICSFTIAGSVFLLKDARAQAVFRTEIYAVPTVTLSTVDFLLGKKDGKPAMIAGELRIPKPGKTIADELEDDEISDKLNVN